MNGVLNYALPLALIAQAAWIARGHSGQIITPRRRLSVLFAAVGLSALADTPAVLLWAADREVIGLLGWAGDALSLVAAASVVEVLSGGGRCDQTWWRIKHATLLLLALAAMAGFAGAGLPASGSGVPTVSYLISYGAYLAVAFSAAMVCGVAIIRSASVGDTERRTVTLVIAAGGWVGIAAALWRQTHISAVGLVHLSDDGVHGSDLLAWAGHAILLAGFTVSAAVARNRRRQRLSHYAQLEPLWLRLTNAVPGVVLPIDALDIDVNMALYRRVVEILDAWHLVRDYLPEDALRPRRPGTVACRIRADAVELLAALEARASGGRPENAPQRPLLRARGDTLDALARWLVAVARAMDELEGSRVRH